MSILLERFIHYFFLLTPFFVLSMFLTTTESYTESERTQLARKILISILIICYCVIAVGNILFSLFGITVDAFRIGAGTLLFISAIKLVYPSKKGLDEGVDEDDDIAVVPLAIPITVGPATIGTLIVMSTEATTMSGILYNLGGISLACFAVFLVLLAGGTIKKIIGARGITILSKLTGLILSAIAAQMVCSGLSSFFRVS